MAIEYNKLKFHYNKLLSITNSEKSKNNINLPNYSNKKIVSCYDNTVVKTHLTNKIKIKSSANLPTYAI